MSRSESYNVLSVNKLELKYVRRMAKQFYLLKCTVLGNITPSRFANGHHHSATTLQVGAVCSSEMFFPYIRNYTAYSSELSLHIYQTARHHIPRRREPFINITVINSFDLSLMCTFVWVFNLVPQPDRCIYIFRL